MATKEIINHLRQRCASFVSKENGAVTVDWIVLTATLIFMGIAIAFYMASSVPEVAENVGSYMNEMTVVPH